MFSPIIALLKWIPLVGWLLGGLVSVAAFIFALVVGGTLACLMIAIAWVFFRPLIGIPLLLATGAGIYFIFFYPWDIDEAAMEANIAEMEGTSTVTPADTSGGTVST